MVCPACGQEVCSFECPRKIAFLEELSPVIFSDRYSDEVKEKIMGIIANLKHRASDVTTDDVVRKINKIQVRAKELYDLVENKTWNNNHSNNKPKSIKYENLSNKILNWLGNARIMVIDDIDSEITHNLQEHHYVLSISYLEGDSRLEIITKPEVAIATISPEFDVIIVNSSNLKVKNIISRIGDCYLDHGIVIFTNENIDRNIYSEDWLESTLIKEYLEEDYLVIYKSYQTPNLSAI